MSWAASFRGFVFGVLTAVFSLPHILRALKELPTRDDEALGRHLADLLHVSCVGPEPSFRDRVACRSSSI